MFGYMHLILLEAKIEVISESYHAIFSLKRKVALISVKEGILDEMKIHLFDCTEFINSLHY